MSKIRTQKHNGITWIDIEKPSRAEFASFATEYNFQPLHIEECLSRGQLPQVEVEKDYLFILLYYPDFIAAENKIVTRQVGVFLGKGYLITVHEDKTPSITHLFTSCEKDPEKREAYLKKSPGYLLYNIIANLLVDLSNLMPPVLKELDDIEDRVFDNDGSDAYQIGQLRQKIMKLRRITAAQKTVLGDLSTSINAFTGEDLQRYYRNNTKTTKRLWETIEEATETVEIYKDADFTTNTEKTNDILAVLTLLFTLTLPATVVGTFYGMNITLPGGVEAGSTWSFLGEYTVLKLVLGISTLSGVLMFWYFKRKHWF